MLTGSLQQTTEISDLIKLNNWSPHVRRWNFQKNQLWSETKNNFVIFENLWQIKWEIFLIKKSFVDASSASQLQKLCKAIYCDAMTITWPNS
jgi:hypothetical protein